ncbi:MAG: transcriptional regulator [Halolamina sp.]
MADSRPASDHPATCQASLGRTRSLGAIDPNGSRQLGRRSAVCLLDDAVVAGLADGSVVAFEQESLNRRWEVDGGADRAGDGSDGTNVEGGDEAGSVTTLCPFADGVLVGERAPGGVVRLLDTETGAVRWSYRGADDVGEPQKETRFFLPFVVDAVADGERAYVAVRRYERGPDGERTFRSVVVAFAPDGTRAWQFRTDASPISLDTDGDRVAVACNRCPGADQDGLVVLDAGSGKPRRRWDPPGDGNRRVGDVSLLPDGLVVTSHADYRGYCLGDDGIRWTVDLGCPVERGDETVYAYPNHVHATESGTVFVLGNSYPEEGRETDARHPAEHTAVGVDPGGEERWRDAVGGFSHEIGAAGDRVAVPVAQHFRERDPSVHGVRTFSMREGAVGDHATPGVGTAVAVRDGTVAAIEEPVSYHDDGTVHGAYRLRG